MQKTLLLLGACLLAFVMSANAQIIFLVNGKLPGYYTNYEVGYSYSFTAITQKQTFTLEDGSKHEFKSNDVKSLMSPGVYMGWTFRLLPLGHSGNSAIGMNVGVQENMFMWKHTSKAFGESLWTTEGTGANGFFDEESVGMSMQIGVPISLDYKFGHDAFKYKNVRFGGSVGIGAMPQINFSTGIPNFESESFNAGVVPFIKGDVSVFAGICIKLRAQVGFATTFSNSENSIFGGMSGGLPEESKVKHDYLVKAPMQATVSLILMPFSWAWDEKGFWNKRIR